MSKERRRPPTPTKPTKSKPIAAFAALLFLAVAAAAGWWWWRGPSFALPPPTADQNVLLVTIDTLRADALSCYGGPARTPNLDHLAASGARFTFAHADAVLTLVSHTSILTGRYPYETGVRDNSGFRVPAGTVTAATRLKALGFATGAFVGGFPLTRRFGLAPGFDVYDDALGEGRGAVDFALPERPADVVVSHAVQWINAQPGKFFAWVHVFDPHAPYRPPPEFAAQYTSQPYYGEVAWTDHALGPLFDRLTTLARPTLVVVTADHGESLGEHGEETHGLFAYEATLHVPLIVAEVRPGATRLARGDVVETPVRHVDLLPTILDAIGVAPDATLPGRSLRGVIAGGDTSDRPEYFESMMGNLSRGWAPLRGVLVGRDKYIDLPIPELYHLLTDPKELNNAAEADARRTSVLLSTLRTYDMAPPNRPAAETHAVSEQLRSLGYVSNGPQAEKSVYTAADDPKTLIKIDQRLHHATDLFETGHKAEAISAVEAVLRERPDTADVYPSLAYMYWDAGEPDRAIATLQAALQRGITAHDVPARLANYLVEMDQPARAIALIAPLNSDDPDTIDALGTAYASVGRTADAMAAFQHAIALDPTNGLAYQNIAAVQISANRLADAEASLRRALALDPSLSGAFTALGVVMARTNRQSDAIDCWRRAVEMDPTEYDALYNLIIVLGQTGQMTEAKAYAQQFLATAPPARYGPDLAQIRRLLGGGNMDQP